MLSKRKLLSPLFRLPIDAYNDGEVSFSLSPSAKRRLEYTKIREEFSDDETDDICNDSDARNVKKSIIGRIFGVIFYVRSGVHIINIIITANSVMSKKQI